LERDADDTNDYEFGCRKLIQIIYDDDDEEHHPDVMLRRTSPRELYRYLKQQYWYLVHTGQLEEDALHLVSILTEHGEELGLGKDKECGKNESSNSLLNGDSRAIMSVPSTDTAISTLDAMLVARIESQKSMVQDDVTEHEIGEIMDDDEKEFRIELERIKDEELSVATEEVILRKALEEDHHYHTNDQHGCPQTGSSSRDDRQ
jgi:hypothetical protein